MSTVCLLPELSVISNGGFPLLDDLLAGVERFDKSCSGEPSVMVAMPDDVMYYDAWREFFVQIQHRYSRFVRFLPPGAADVVIRTDGQEIDVYVVGMIRRMIARADRCIAVVRRVARSSSYIRICHSNLHIRVPSLEPPFNMEQPLLIWKAHQLASSYQLILMGAGDVEEVALGLSVEFGFSDVDTLIVDGAPSKAWLKTRDAKAKNPKNLCIATKRVGHAHTKGSPFKVVDSATHSALADAIFEELLLRARDSTQ